MKAWLNEPVLRAEAIAWALCVPTVMLVSAAGWAVVGGLSTVRQLSSVHQQVPLPAELQLYIGAGELWLAVAFGVCGVLPLLALITRQRFWVQLVAPLVCGVVVYVLFHGYAASSREWLISVGRHSGLDTSVLEPR